MSRTYVLVAALLVAGAPGCQHALRPGVTSLTSAPISTDARAVTTANVEASGGTARATTNAERSIRPAVGLDPESGGAAYTPPSGSYSTDETTSAPPPSVRMGTRTPLVTPGLDNTVSGGVANTGAPFNYGYGNNGNVTCPTYPP